MAFDHLKKLLNYFQFSAIHQFVRGGLLTFKKEATTPNHTPNYSLPPGFDNKCPHSTLRNLHTRSQLSCPQAPVLLNELCIEGQ